MKEEMFEGTAKRVRVGGSCRFIAYGNDHVDPKEEKHFFKKDTGIKGASINACLRGTIAMVGNCAFRRDASIFHTWIFDSPAWTRSGDLRMD